MTRGMLAGLRIAAPVCALIFLSTSGLSAEPQKLSGYKLDDKLCGAYPRLPIGMREGTCAGIVASEEDGLQFPRSIIQIPGHDQFVVVDMGGWAPSKGRLLLLDPVAPAGKRLKTLLDHVDYPFGLGIGPDKKLYASTASTIFRFDPLVSSPKDTIETIVQGLPARNITLVDGTKIEESAHPFKPFVFDKTGRLYVNIGAPTDACIAKASNGKPCAAGEGANPLASVWAYTPPAGGIFPVLKRGDANPVREIFARGLRNSMALAIHPGFPDEGFAFLQGENARDLPDPLKPNEELNALEKGKHYGWPYCYDLVTPSPEFKAVLSANGTYKDLCNNKVFYRAPYSLMPPHAAPLSMLYYHGAKFSELEGKLIVGLHGYRPSGGRVIAYDVDAKGFPAIAPPPVIYHVSCAADPTRPLQTEREPQVAAAPFSELVAEWHKVLGVRPQGAPVGLAVASDGAIWVVEDKNQTIIRIDGTTDPAPASLPCTARTDKQIDELVSFVEKNKDNKQRLREIRTQLVAPHCVACHAGFGLREGQTDEQKDAGVLRFILGQDSWVYPGDPNAGRLRTRLRGLGGEKLMPPGGEALSKEMAYKKLLDTVDTLVSTMVPGQRLRVKGGRVDRGFVNRQGKECGRVPANIISVVLEKAAKNKPGFSRIYRPADLYLNGECSDDDGYYIEQSNLVPL